MENSVGSGRQGNKGSRAEGGVPVKIAVSGTHCVGKTTALLGLASALKTRGYSVELVFESARESPFAINEDADSQTQLWIMFHQLEKEIEAMKKRPDFVLVDRALPDVYVYYQYLLNTGRIRISNEFQIIKALSEKWQGSYKKVFLVGKESIELEADGLRSTDINFRDEIDARMRSKYEGHPNCMEIEGSTEERVSAMLTCCLSL